MSNSFISPNKSTNKISAISGDILSPIANSSYDNDSTNYKNVLNHMKEGVYKNLLH
jgi:hypothetical protein